MEGVVLEAKFSESFARIMSSDNPAELSNSELAQEVIKACWQAGCREFVVCAGSRNSPLVLELLNLEQITEGLKLWNFFEERSAAFFCTGPIKEQWGSDSRGDDLWHSGGGAASGGGRGALCGYPDDSGDSGPAAKFC